LTSATFRCDSQLGEQVASTRVKQAIIRFEKVHFEASETDVMQSATSQRQVRRGGRPTWTAAFRRPTDSRKLERSCSRAVRQSVDGFSEAREEVVAMHEYPVAATGFLDGFAELDSGPIAG